MKIRKLIALSTIALGFGAVVSLAPAKRIEVRAEEETTVVEEVEQKQNKFIDELLAPLVVALASSNVGTLIGMGVIAFIRNRKEKARNSEMFKIITSLLEYIKKLDEAELKIEKMIEIFEKSYGNAMNIIEEEKGVLLSYKEDLQRIKELKVVMVAMAEAQLAQIKGQAENIKSGLAHEVSEIEEKLKLLK